MGDFCRFISENAEFQGKIADERGQVSQIMKFTVKLSSNSTQGAGLSLKSGTNLLQFKQCGYVRGRSDEAIFGK